MKIKSNEGIIAFFLIGIPLMLIALGIIASGISYMTGWFKPGYGNMLWLAGFIILFCNSAMHDNRRR